MKTPTFAKTLVAFVHLAFFGLCAATANAQTSKKVGYKMAFDDRANFRIYSQAGTLTVTTWDKDSLQVRGVAPAGVDVRCGGSRTGAKCFIDYGGDETDPPPVNLEIIVPRHLQLWLKTAAGDITVTNFDGDLDAYSVSGNIRLEGKPQNVTLESMAGNITTGANAQTLRAKTASGAITITGAVEDVEASSVSGNINLQNGRFVRGRFDATDADIRWRGPIDTHAGLEFGSHSGNIIMQIPLNSGGAFSVSSFQGTIMTSVGRQQMKVRDMREREMKFVLRGDDRARITIRNFKGKTEITGY